MITVPPLTPSTSPVEALILAVVGRLLFQIPPGVASDNVMVESSHTLVGPVIGAGIGLIVTTVVV
jgi:hypothetical protein